MRSMTRRHQPKIPVPSEHVEQVNLFEWARLAQAAHPALRLLYAIPNGGMRNKAVAGKLRAEGVKPGVLDLCLPVPRGVFHGLYIEMKRQEGGRVSKDQARWIADLRAEGYSAVVCHGWMQAREVLLAYLALSCAPSGSIPGPAVLQ